MRIHPILIIAGILLLAGCQHQSSSPSPYQGQEQQEIKALSATEIADLRSGAGMGFAKAAELNHFPGPKHVLELEDKLELTAKQKQDTQASFQRMQVAAKELGQQIIDLEAGLEQLFQSSGPSPDSIQELTRRIGTERGKLRFVHLNAHLEMREILTAEQITLYDQLRGYGEGGSHNHEGSHSGGE